MPSESPTAASRFMCLFRLTLVFCYLIAISYGAIVYPDIIFVQSGSWFKPDYYQLTYRTTYKLDFVGIAMNLVFIGNVLVGIFRSCRCKFFGAPDFVMSPMQGRWRLWLPMLPFFMHFFGLLLVTILVCSANLWHIMFSVGFQDMVSIFRNILVLLFIKCLIGVNALLLLLRCIFLITENPQNTPILNEYDFGEHLNVIFRV